MSGIDDTKPGKHGAAYGEGVAARLLQKAGAGRLEKADAVGQAGSADCGGLVRIELAIAEGIVQDAAYQAYGCPATLACASELTALVKGTSFLQAASISESAVISALGLAPDKRWAAALAMDALHSALGTVAMSGDGLHGSPEPDEKGILVGMSGGVDSAVAAMLLKRQHYKVVGATLKLWSDSSSAGRLSCCSPEAVRRARRVAHSLGIPHLTLDASDAFFAEVVSYFVTEYAAGRTPNPCTKCNARVRFGLMLSTARRIGLSKVATGHYARLTGAPAALSRGADRQKDQSYVLAEVAPEILSRVMFPLGEMCKADVRTLAAEASLEGCEAPESQEICFITDDDHRRFLRERLGERPGTIVSARGGVLGSHSGTYNFTIGQRKGLGIAARNPLYVVSLDTAEGTVVVGEADELAVGKLTVGNLVLHRCAAARNAFVQVRSTGGVIPAHLVLPVRDVSVLTQTDTVGIILEEIAFGVAPGQTAVVYDGDSVVLAGTIVSTSASSVR